MRMNLEELNALSDSKLDGLDELILDLMNYGSPEHYGINPKGGDDGIGLAYAMYFVTKDVRPEIPAKICNLKNLTKLCLSSNQITKLPKEIGKLNNLTELSLDQNKLSELPKEIARLKNLEYLNISKNNFTKFPIEIAELRKLKVLKLYKSDLSQLPKEIASLKNLEYLDISENNFSKFPIEIAELRKLKVLKLSNNQITKLPKEIGKLNNLTELSLDQNKLSELPKEIGNLNNLTKLDLKYQASNSCNNTLTLPKEIGKLNNLTELLLRGNKLTELPKEIGNLNNLTKLYLYDNQITKLPKEIGKLNNLTELSLEHNKLSELPKEIASLKKLTELELSNNQITKLPKEIGKLNNLTELHLKQNKLSELPKEIANLSKLTSIFINHNPLTLLPKEITNLNKLDYIGINEGVQLVRPPQNVAIKGVDAIRLWFEQEAEQGTVKSYETKVLLLGSPEVGKTSFRKKAENLSYELTVDENRTTGVEIFHWNFKLDTEKQKDCTAHLFDFGGQEIQYMAHQFFISPDEFYILMLNHTYKDNETAYWLDCIYAINQESPSILPIYNTWNNKKEVKDFPALKNRAHLLDMVRLSLNEDIQGVLERDFRKIQELISHHIQKHPKETLTYWQYILEEINLKSDNYISIDQFRDLCKENYLVDEAYQDQLLDYLNSLGHVLYFKMHEPDTVFLKPNWLIKAMYTLFKPCNSFAERGQPYFMRKQLMEAWKIPDTQIERPAYSERERNILFRLLLKDRFNICFKVDEQKYLIPQYLGDKPVHINNILSKAIGDKETIHYGYKFLPLGFMASVIVQLHDLINADYIWLQGALLFREQATALIEQRESNAYGNHISITIIGHEKNRNGLKRRIIGALTKLFDMQYNHYNHYKYIPCEGCLEQAIKGVKGHKFTFGDNKVKCPECGTERKLNIEQVQEITYIMNNYEGAKFGDIKVTGGSLEIDASLNKTVNTTNTEISNNEGKQLYKELISDIEQIELPERAKKKLVSSMKSTLENDFGDNDEPLEDNDLEETLQKVEMALSSGDKVLDKTSSIWQKVIKIGTWLGCTQFS